MASAASSSQALLDKLEEELECSFCLERLKDPRVFPCQHSFCYKCIVDLSRGKSIILCPECRAEVEVGDPPDLSHFKRNHRINNILECMKNDLSESTNPEIHERSIDETTTFNNCTLPNRSDGEESEEASSIPQTSEDIENMKLTFLKLSDQDIKKQEQLIKEQEHHLLKNHSIGTSLDDYWSSKNEDPTKLDNHVSRNQVSQATYQVNRDQRIQTSNNHQPITKTCVQRNLDVGSMKDNRSSMPQTSEDIVNMESKFLRKSTDQIIKEQEQLLKKIIEEEKRSEKRNCESNRAGLGTSLDDYWSSKNEDPTKLDNHVSHNNQVSQATYQVNRDQRMPITKTSVQRNLDVSSMTDNRSSMPQTSEDIVNMESKFSKQSTDQCIKEQEQLLKKIIEEKRSEKRNYDSNRAGLGTSLDDYWSSKNEDPTKLDNHVSHNNQVSQATYQVNRDQRMPITKISVQRNLDVGSMKDNRSSMPQTSEDIVNMESKFSKQSTDQCIKEQEQLLKKIIEEEEKTSEKRNYDSNRAGLGTSLDNYRSSKNEDSTKLDNHVPHNNHVSQATIRQINRDQRIQTSNNHQPITKTSVQRNLDVGSMKDNSPTSMLQTSDDIVNMESKFLGKSTDQVIKEQEQLLKKIKEEQQKTSEKRNCDWYFI